MMSQRNLELVRRAFAEYGQPALGFEEAARSGLIAPDVEVDPLLCLRRKGALVFMHVTAEGEGGGVPVEMRNAHEYTIRDGVRVRVKVCASRDEALEAAELRE